MEIEYWLKKRKWNVYEGLLLLANFNPNRTKVVWCVPEEDGDSESGCVDVQDAILLDKHLEPSLVDRNFELESLRNSTEKISVEKHVEIRNAQMKYFDHEVILTKLYWVWLESLDRADAFDEQACYPPIVFLNWVKDQGLDSKVAWWNESFYKKYKIEKKELLKIKTIDMEIALAKYFDPRRNLIVPNVSWGMFYYTQEGLHECDLLICTKSNYLWEVEIKISKADLIADKKKKHGHVNSRIKRLYFAIPEYLEDCIEHIPERAGIILVRQRINGLDCLEIRPPKQQKGYKLEDKERLKLAHLGAMRIWTLKKNLAKKQTALF